LESQEIILVKDVDGFKSGDPKHLSKYKTIDLLHADEALMLTGSGSRIIHTRALIFKPEDINIRVVGFESKDILQNGTLIVGKTNSDIGVYLVSPEVTMVTVLGGFDTLVNTGKFLNGVEKLKHKVLGASLDRSSITTYISGDLAKERIQSIHDYAIEAGAKAITTEGDLSMVAISGHRLETKPHVINTITKQLKRENINIYGLFTSNSRIKILIKKDCFDLCYNLVRDGFKELEEGEKDGR
jgi:aspartate kinase